MNLVDILNEYLKTDQITKLQTMKNNDEFQIYMIETKNLKKYFAKATKNELSNNRKRKEIEACRLIKSSLTDFPCVIPRAAAYSNSFVIYLEEAIEGNEIINFMDNDQIVLFIFKDLARLLLDMHSVEIYRCNIKEGTNNPENWRNFVNKSIHAYIKTIIKENIVSKETIKAFYCYWNKYESVLDNVNKCSLVHNDLNGENILLNKKHNLYGVSGIIDFERCILGDPVKDISKLVWMFRKNPYAGKIFIEEYFKIRGNMEEVLTKIKLYFIWDVLYHLHQQKYLIQFPQWKVYLEEEKMLLNNILLKEECKLW